MKKVPFLVLALFILFACDGGDDDPTGAKSVEKTIIASAGGILTTSDSVELSVPAGALPMDGIVFLGQTGEEPTSVPNPNLKIIGHPITIKFPSELILKPITLSFPLGSSSVYTKNNLIVLFNGSTYFPVEYSINEETIDVSIDIIDWDSAGGKGGINSLIVAIVLEIIHPDNLMDIKKVTINKLSGEIDYSFPTSCPKSKILLFIHGLNSSPTIWKDFLSWISLDSNSPYTEYWTFGYNSNLSINTNGQLLSRLIKQYGYVSQIDIVAHSMGGLVSRSMIEKYHGADYIRKLITLGTPHNGSPLVVLRYLAGCFVGISDPIFAPENVFSSDGFLDLDPSSDFIIEMEANQSPPLPYYTVASINNPSYFSKITSNILQGNDDGVVSGLSAHGAIGAQNAGDITIDAGFAHMAMTSNQDVFNQVYILLKGEKPIVVDIDCNIYQTVQIGTQLWMKENLKTTRYRNGDLIGTTTPATLDVSGEITPKYQWAYDGTEFNVPAYGRLYTWYAVTDSRNVCPTGWHVPSYAEWTTLTDYLTNNGYGYGGSGGDIAKSMASTSGWTTNETAGNVGNDQVSNNSSGFTALPSGLRWGSGPFNYSGIYVGWWSSTEHFPEPTAYLRTMTFDFSGVYGGYFGSRGGLAVRCLQD